MNYFAYSTEDLSQKELMALAGLDDRNLIQLQQLYHVDLVMRDNQLKFLSEDSEQFDLFCQHIDFLLDHLDELDHDMIKQSYLEFSKGMGKGEWKDKTVGYTASGKPIHAKTRKQASLLDEIERNDLTFTLGPAGTGKTYLAVFMACKAFKSGQVERIILTRPAVEAGESLGFLPGDLKEKVDPYLMPLYDALNEILGTDNVERMIERGQIEILPLAYMRGRTLNDAFVILDEAQNTTAGQMLMFLTRLGRNTKMVVNGDVTQIDLKGFKGSSGLVVASEKLKNIAGISFVEFSADDIVRNPLVQTIIEHFSL